MNHLFIGAHPDDIEYACAGTIIKLLKGGHRVKCIVATRGGNSEEGAGKNQRTHEQKNAFKKMGVKEYVILNMPDGAIGNDAMIIGRIAREIKIFDADYVYTHYPQDSHQDHRNLSASVMSASRGQLCNIIYFDSYSSLDFEPNWLINIDGLGEVKREVIDCFTSQVDKFRERGTDFAEKAILKNRLFGYEAGCGLAEAYRIYRLIERNE